MKTSKAGTMLTASSLRPQATINTITIFPIRCLLSLEAYRLAVGELPKTEVYATYADNSPITISCTGEGTRVLNIKTFEWSKNNSTANGGNVVMSFGSSLYHNNTSPNLIAYLWVRTAQLSGNYLKFRALFIWLIMQPKMRQMLTHFQGQKVVFHQVPTRIMQLNSTAVLILSKTQHPLTASGSASVLMSITTMLLPYCLYTHGDVLYSCRGVTARKAQIPQRMDGFRQRVRQLAGFFCLSLG